MMFPHVSVYVHVKLYVAIPHTHTHTHIYIYIYIYIYISIYIYWERERIILWEPIKLICIFFPWLHCNYFSIRLLGSINILIVACFEMNFNLEFKSYDNSTILCDRDYNWDVLRIFLLVF